MPGMGEGKWYLGQSQPCRKQHCLLSLLGSGVPADHSPLVGGGRMGFAPGMLGFKKQGSMPAVPDKPELGLQSCQDSGVWSG